MIPKLSPNRAIELPCNHCPEAYLKSLDISLLISDLIGASLQSSWRKKKAPQRSASSNFERNWSALNGMGALVAAEGWTSFGNRKNMEMNWITINFAAHFHVNLHKPTPTLRSIQFWIANISTFFSSIYFRSTKRPITQFFIRQKTNKKTS